MTRGRVSLATIVALVAALVVVQPAPAGPGWPQDGYDAGHSHANTQEWRLRRDNVGGLELLWSRSVRPPGITQADFLFEGVSVPVVRGSAFASWWGSEVDAPRLSALDPRTGRIRWSRASDWEVAAASAETAFANASGRIVAVDVRSGERRWARWHRVGGRGTAPRDRPRPRLRLAPTPRSAPAWRDLDLHAGTASRACTARGGRGRWFGGRLGSRRGPGRGRLDTTRVPPLCLIRGPSPRRRLCV